jgi:hypothetical protein
METHVKVLAVLQIVLGALGVLIGLGVFAIMGGVAGIVQMDGGNDAEMVVPLLGVVGGFVMILMLVVSVPGIIAGIGLLSFQPWARILTLVLSILNLVNIPFGTMIGAYGLWALLKPESTALFEPRRVNGPRGLASNL